MSYAEVKYYIYHIFVANENSSVKWLSIRQCIATGSSRNNVNNNKIRENLVLTKIF